MNPYERTTDEMKRQAEGPKRFGKAALSVGSALGAASFIPLLSRAAPFLSQYIPENLAIKGLSKISPKFGKFVQEAIDGGYDFQQVKDFIGEQINKSKQPEKKGNIIQQYSPELHQLIDQEIKKGGNYLKAGSKAIKDPKFAKIIKKIEKDHGLGWWEIMESIYGEPQQEQQQPQQSSPPMPQPAQQGQAAPQGQSGQGNQALMAAIQKVQQLRGGA